MKGGGLATLFSMFIFVVFQSGGTEKTIFVG